MSKWYIIAIAAMTLWSCKAERIVTDNNREAVTLITQKDTVIMRDSIYTHHETFSHTSNDTVYIENVIYKYKEVGRSGTYHLDTIINVTDTVTIYQLTDGQQSTKFSPSWSGIIIVIICLFALAYAMKKHE